MYVAAVDRSLGESEWRPFVEAQGFGHLVAPGRELDYPVVVPTQFVLSGDEVLTHFAGPNPVFAALRARPRAVLAVGGDWAFIPSDWKAIDEEDPAMGIPTTYYAEVQLRGRTQVRQEPSEVAEVLRRQLAVLQPDTPVADPEEAHRSKLRGIKAVVLTVEDVVGKFKYGGNVDQAHRISVIEKLRARRAPGDLAAAGHVARRLQVTPEIR